MENPIICSFAFVFLIIILVLIILIIIKMNTINESYCSRCKKQSVCPISGKPLGQRAVRVTVRGQTVRLCSHACVDKLRKQFRR